MAAIYRKVTDIEKDSKIIDEAAEALVKGKLVALPTETVYGIGANAMDEDAIKAIFRAKGRPSDNPLIVHIARFEDLDKYATFVPLVAKKLANKFWPGPLTMIFNKKSNIPDVVTCKMKTVAIRIPDNEIALEIISRSQLPIAAPSANLSGRPSPTTADHVVIDLGEKIDMIIDGGSCDIGLESTVLDLTRGLPVILRYGKITQEMIEEVIGPIMIDPTLEGRQEAKVPLAPGMKYTHYSPKAEMYIVKGPENKVIEKMNQMIDMNTPRKVGILTCNENQIKFKGEYVLTVGSISQPEKLAHNLFAILRRFDDLNVDIIYAQAFEEKGIGIALMNRLYKAAGNRILNVEE